MANILNGGFNVWVLVKTLTLVLLGMYIIFAFVIVRQVKLMTSTLRLGSETFMKLLTYLHLAFAIFVFLAALIIL